MQATPPILPPLSANSERGERGAGELMAAPGVASELGEGGRGADIVVADAGAGAAALARGCSGRERGFGGGSDAGAAGLGYRPGMAAAWGGRARLGTAPAQGGRARRWQWLRRGAAGRGGGNSGSGATRGRRRWGKRYGFSFKRIFRIFFN
jgi:hypothetical protein